LATEFRCVGRSRKINKENGEDLKLACAVAIGSTAANENLEATPLAEDGFLYVAH
jgi:alcohol dehydrogenase (cytochrome c)